MKLLVIVAVVSGCSFHGSDVPPGDANEPPRDTGGRDRDASPNSLVVTDPCTTMPLTTLDLGTVMVGQEAEGEVLIPFDTSETLSLTGDNPAIHFGGGLVDEHVFVRFTPTQLGDLSGTVVAGAGNIHTRTGRSGTFQVTAHVIPAAAGLFSSKSTFATDLGLALSNTSTTTPLVIESSTLDSEDLSGTLGFSGCDGLDPGQGGCSVTASVLVEVPGCTTRTFHIHSTLNTADVSYRYGHAIKFTSSATNGTITFAPSGTTCADQTDCNLAFLTPVTATATAGTFQSWSAKTPCGQNASCSIPLTDIVQDVSARFATPGAPVQTLTVVGPGSVQYVDDGVPVVCSGTCTLSPTGIPRLLASSGVGFVGWSGACTGTTAACFPGTGAASIIATFVADPRETILIPPQAGTSGTLDVAPLPGGDVVSITQDTLSRVTSAGAVVWQQHASMKAVATTAAGDTYVLYARRDSPTIKKLDGDGNVVWSRDVIHPVGHTLCGGGAHALATLPNGNVAWLGYHEVHVLDASDGHDLFVDALPLQLDCSTIAADSNGNLAVLVTGAIRRYVGSTHVMPDVLVPVTTQDLAYDPSGGIVAVASDFLTTSSLTRIASNGTQTFSVDPGPGARRVAVASNGTIVVDTRPTSGEVLHGFNDSGAELWTIDKPQRTTATLASSLIVSSITAGASGRVLVGAESGDQISRAWVDVIDATLPADLASKGRRTTSRRPVR